MVPAAPPASKRRRAPGHFAPQPKPMLARRQSMSRRDRAEPAPLAAVAGRQRRLAAGAANRKPGVFDASGHGRGSDIGFTLSG
jgi:hypothetical protein